jgi:hypothetical protein
VKFKQNTVKAGCPRPLWNSGQPPSESDQPSMISFVFRIECTTKEKEEIKETKECSMYVFKTDAHSFPVK